MKHLQLIRKNKKADLELDQIGKLILGVILLLILIYIVVYLIGGEFSSQNDKVTSVFNAFN